MTIFETLQTEHVNLLDQLDTGTDDVPKPSIDVVRDYIERVRVAAASVAGPRERDQLRANLNFWGAYVYEHTRTYPETALSPARPDLIEPRHQKPRWQSYRELIANATPYRGSRAQTAPGPWWQNPYYLVGGLLAILVIFLVMWAGYALLRAAFAPALPTTPPVTVTATAHYVEMPLTPTEPPTATPPGTEPQPATHTPTSTPVRRTPTPESPTLTPTPSPPPQTLRQQVVASLEVAPAACDARTLEVRVADDALKLLGERGISARLSASDGQLLASNSLTSQREIVTFGSAILARQSGSTLLRLRSVSDDVTTTDVIIDFAEDCSRNTMRVIYQLVEAPAVVETLKSAANLALDWELLTWGPSPGGETWVARLQLLASGVDASALFWLDGQRLEGDIITVEAPACEPARHAIGVSAGGEVVLRELVLLSPYCP